MTDKTRIAAYVGAYFVRISELVPDASLTINSGAPDRSLRLRVHVHGQDEDGERLFEAGRYVGAALSADRDYDAAAIAAKDASLDGGGLQIALGQARVRAERAATRGGLSK